MQPVSKGSAITVRKIGDIIVDPSRLKVDPNLLKKLFPATCAGNFSGHFATVKKQSVSATLTILPNDNDTLNNPSMGDTSVTFKAADGELSKKLTDWHPDLVVPPHTVAYAQFPNVNYFSGGYEGILCIVTAAQKVHRLFLKRPDGEHVWYSDITMSYCKKDKLFLLTSSGYTLSVDFGL
ncbi:hypothetical protein [Spirosoma luteum]|uniref:hypothetical protein n=1 Tax=Spirosoma luteum TaxID=431553 RepID=UPI0003800837|nr:hypothetical protein [Spirosoma luteum]